MPRDRLNEFFLPIVRSAFSELGLGEREIITYVSGLLVRFARADHLYRLRSVEGKPIDRVVEMAVQLMTTPVTAADIEQQREVRRYVGDYALFMTGIFRAHVSQGGYLDYYLREGSRSYRAVSELDLALYRTGFLLFQDLSERFEFYSGALDYLRQAYFTPFGGEDPFAAFLSSIPGWERLVSGN